MSTDAPQVASCNQILQRPRHPTVEAKLEVFRKIQHLLARARMMEDGRKR
jgi:hypothetical protein